MIAGYDFGHLQDSVEARCTLPGFKGDTDHSNLSGLHTAPTALDHSTRFPIEATQHAALQKLINPFHPRDERNRHQQFLA